MKQFEDLPFNVRPDLSPYLVHLTKNTTDKNNYSAYENLVKILKDGEIWGSAPKKGLIKGKRKAACFMDVPFASLKYVLTPENTDPKNPRYEPYGIAVTKKYAYRNGCRPVLYLSNEELDKIQFPVDELWRVVRFEERRNGWISWLHEREWRAPDRFILPTKIQSVFVRSPKEAYDLTKQLHHESDDFPCEIGSVISMTVLCQGLLPSPVPP